MEFDKIYILFAILLALLMIPLFIFLMARRRKQTESFVNSRLWSKLAPEKSSARLILKFVLLVLAFIMMDFASSGPLWGSKNKKVKKKGSELMIALDVSNSMMAQDIQPNRLERAKIAISSLIEKLKGDRVGLIVFAGTSAVQLPLTSDYSAAQMLTASVNTGLIGTQGTDIGAALTRCVSSFGSTEQKGSRAILIISDGEDHEPEAVEKAKLAQENGIVVHTLGMGTSAGVPIPIYNGANFAGYKTDKNGSTVVTKLNEQALLEISKAGAGQYFSGVNTSEAVVQIVDELDKLEKQEYDTKDRDDLIDRYQWALIPALLFLIVEVFISERRSGKFIKKELFD